jgi:hypothetical protein
MFRLFSVIISLFALSACGGGTSLSDLDRKFDTTGANTSKIVKEYSSGDSIMASKGIFKLGNSSGETFYIFALTKDTKTLEDTFNGVISLQTSNYTDFDGTDYYSYDGSGINANGEQITSSHLGYYDIDTDVGYFYANIGGHENLATLGYVPIDRPNGIHTYSNGDIRIIYKGTVEDSYDTATLIANFSTNKGDLLAETENLFMSATNFDINSVNGQISGSVAKVGNLNNPSDFTNAEILGAFSGLYSDGVHGIIFQTEDSASIVPGSGIFYLVNNRLFD